MESKLLALFLIFLVHFCQGENHGKLLDETDEMMDSENHNSRDLPANSIPVLSHQR